MGKQPKKRVSYKKFGKLMLIVCCATHAILAAVASAGPTPDVDQLAGILDRRPVPSACKWVRDVWQWLRALRLFLGDDKVAVYGGVDRRGHRPILNCIFCS